MLNILRRISDKGHLVVVTMQSIPQETAHHFNQLILLRNKQVCKKSENENVMELVELRKS